MRDSSLKILIVTSEFPPQPGGIGNHAYNLALHLSQQGHRVKVIADQRSRSGTDEAHFDAALTFSVKRIKLHNFRFIMYLKRIVHTVKSTKRTTHCIVTGKFSLWNVAFSSFLFNRKTIAVVHGTEVNFKSILIRNSIDFSLKRFDKIVAVSKYTKSLISELNKEVVVIPNGITVSQWKAPNEKMKLKGDPVITTVGRVSIRKGQLNVINQLPELIKTYPDLHYHCVGIPTEADAFIKVAESLHINNHVTFHGSVDEETLKQVLDATDIFVMLSTESSTGDVEGFGIAILEANAMGIPAIGAKGCGIEDAIVCGKSGILIDTNNSNEFVEGISKILGNLSQFRSEAKAWANTHDWSHIIKHYEALL
ncbi:glycosyltransferase family 4 protein [Winogradskyella schleiferi]|uniref:glycosyltransferase family 4 protein n=1 Tax=Winogradskyella schleiferi TaxID=2686078 RepID=UPI0015B9E2A0|nr:glycosyltransferase family 4 protein [Winogradskyella schleiferi]